MSLPLISKYLISASVFAFTISNSLVTFSMLLYFSIFFTATSLSYSTESIKSIFPFSFGFILIVLFNATIPSVVSPTFPDRGLDS